MKIGYDVAPLPIPLEVSALVHLSDGHVTQSTGIQHFYDRVSSYIIDNAIDGSITKKLSQET